MKPKPTTVLTLAFVASCATDAQDQQAITTGDAPPQLVPGGSGKGDGPTSTDPRILNCQLEYEAFTPYFANAPAASFDTPVATILNDGIGVARTGNLGL